MSSISSQVGSSPVSASVFSIRLVIAPSRNCPGDRLTDSRSGGRPARCHWRCWRQALLEDALGQRPDQADVLGQTDELARPDHAAARMAPAQQRLDADDLAALEIALRLVVDRELVGREGLAQLALEQTGAARHEVHLRGEEAAAVAAVGLRPVHRELGVLEQAVGRLTVGREQRDADAGAGVELLAVEHERLAEAVDQAARQRARLVGVADVGLQDHELVAAEPADRVGLAQAGMQALGDRLEQQVAAGQAEGVVDALEAVEVEQQHRGDAVGCAAPGRAHGRGSRGTTPDWAGRSARRGRPGGASAPRPRFSSVMSSETVTTSATRPASSSSGDLVVSRMRS